MRELYLVDFIEWDERYVVREELEEGSDRGKIIQFEERGSRADLYI